MKVEARLECTMFFTFMVNRTRNDGFRLQLRRFLLQIFKDFAFARNRKDGFGVRRWGGISDAGWIHVTVTTR